MLLGNIFFRIFWLLFGDLFVGVRAWCPLLLAICSPATLVAMAVVMIVIMIMVAVAFITADFSFSFRLRVRIGV